VTRIAIATIRDERLDLRVRERAGRELKRMDEHVVARQLVVEREATGRSDLRDAAVVAAPAERRRATRRAAVRRAICGPQRLRPEHVLRVGQDQLLVLLLVMQAELDSRGIEHALGEATRDALVDLRAIRVHALEARPREHPTPWPIDARPDGLVVAVEQLRERRIEHRFGEDEGLEEPGRVREVPLRGARIDHGLHDLVLDGERRAQRHSSLANMVVPKGIHPKV
jgi:hypothetical protein